MRAITLVVTALISAPVCAAEISGIVTEVSDGDSLTLVKPDMQTSSIRLSDRQARLGG
jgi:endonuclease YncB( thermonuclease family)